MRIVMTSAVVLSLALAGDALAQGSGLTAQERAAAFDAADANHDGKVDPGEFLNTPRGRSPNNPILNWLASDKNKDGSVSKQEFVEPMTGEDLSAAPASPPTPNRGGKA